MIAPASPALVRPEQPQAVATVRPWLLAVTYLLLSAAALYPVFAVTVPPLVDYPNHLARTHIIATLDNNIVLQEYYYLNWAVIPNLAQDLVLPPLVKFINIYDAGRLFVSLIFLMLIGGTVALHRVLYGWIGFWPAVIFLCLYNFVLSWGFLNYLFTIGLCLLVLSAWIATAHWPAWARLTVFSVASVVLFFGHLFAFGVYGLTVVAYECGRFLRGRPQPARLIAREWATVLGQFAVPAVLWLTSPTSSIESATRYGSIFNKIIAVVSPTLFYVEPLDYVTFGFIVLVLMIGLASQSIKLHPAMRFPLIVVGTAAALMPNTLLGVWGTDFRLPLVLVCLFVAGTRIQPRNFRLAQALGAVALVLFAARIWSVTETWWSYDRQFAELRAATRTLEEGARILTVMPEREAIDEAVPFHAVYWHISALAVIERAAFDPLLFTNPDTQPVVTKPAYSAIDALAGQPILPEQLRAAADPIRAAELARTISPGGNAGYWLNWPAHFDYVLLMHFGVEGITVPQQLTAVASGSFFDIYRVDHSESRRWGAMRATGRRG